MSVTGNNLYTAENRGKITVSGLLRGLEKAGFTGVIARRLKLIRGDMSNKGKRVGY